MPPPASTLPRAAASGATLQPTRADRARVASLLAWYRKSARDLPWRQTRDPYRIWISETMLQQTRVAAVLPYYERFLAEFPTVRHLARASEERVLGRWSGLGYYTRARNLRRAAARIVEQHGGRFPSDPEALSELPGIGPYTRGALLSLAFDRPYPVVDGNVERLLARWFRIEEDPKKAAGKRLLWSLAETLLPPDAPGEFNQALMELGARVCRPRTPLCGACPIAGVCRARRDGDPESYPRRRARARATVSHGTAVLVRSGEQVLFVRRTAGENRGLLDLPAVQGEVALDSASAVRALRIGLQRLGVTSSDFRELGRIRHAVMSYDYRILLFEARLRRPARRRLGRAPEKAVGRGLRWLSRDDWSAAPLTARARKALAVLGREQPSQRRPGKKKSVRKSSVRRKPARS